MNENFYSNFCDVALCYAERGLAVFPLLPQSKEPATSHGFKDATTDQEQIRQWWSENPNFNIGIATGNVPGVIVIDVDGQAGEQSLVILEQEYGKLPVTVTQITPGKIIEGQHTGRGRHLIFKTGGRSFSCQQDIFKSKSKVDIKSDGGYIVAARSIHPHGTGFYEFAAEFSFEDMEPAELPSTWVTFLHSEQQKKKRAAATEHTLPSASEAVIEACRQEIARCMPAIEGDSGDKQTFTIACTIFHDWGLSELEGKAILDEYNLRCKPMWTEIQLLHKIDCAIVFPGEKPRGWKRFEHPIEGEYYPPFGAFVLHPSRTQPIALAFRRAVYSHAEGFTLRYHTGNFYHWSGNYYRQVSADTIKAGLLDWMTRAVMLKKGESVRFPAKNATVNDTLEALKGICAVDNLIESGAWLGDADEMPLTTPPIFTQNCVYDWQTETKYPRSPLWFNQSCVNTLIEDNPMKPERWNQFLDDLWGDDQASKDLLHEFMGLTFSLDTSFQKILLLLGPPRAGKGTIARILTAIHGHANVAAPTTESLTHDFGLQPLLGKPLAIISDARFAGRNIQVAIERLLNISGEDSITINRKYRDPVTVKLPTRLIIISNELPRLPDNAGALANRFLALRLQKTFLGQEDRGLNAALLQELPGILNLMIEGLQRLHRQGFSQPVYHETLIRDLEELGAPVRTFVREHCDLGTDKRASTESLWAAYKRYQGEECGSQSAFGRSLKACYPDIVKKRHHEDGYCYYGIGLRSSKTALRVFNPNTSDLTIRTAE